MVRLMGGLGNQMFQYAFGRSLSVKYNSELVLDTTLLDDRTLPNEIATYRQFDLDIFKKLNYRLATKKEIFLFNGNAKASIIEKAKRKLVSTISSSKLVIQKNNEIEFNSGDNTCYVGRWQSYKFFDEKLIRAEFNLESPKINGIQEMAQQIEECNSICLHVRRADLVSSSLYNKTIGVLGMDYYKKAIEALNGEINDLNYFVFSDDINWCKENVVTGGKTIYIDDKFSGKKAEGHLFLMTKCKHFIISNSTFSWWGAFLSENKNKKVIYPKNWFKDSTLQNFEMSPLEWIGI